MFLTKLHTFKLEVIKQYCTLLLYTGGCRILNMKKKKHVLLNIGCVSPLTLIYNAGNTLYISPHVFSIPTCTGNFIHLFIQYSV